MGKAVFTSNKGLRSCTDKNYLLETENQCVSKLAWCCSPSSWPGQPCICAGQVSVTSGGEMAWSAPHLDTIRARAAVQGRVDAFELPGGICLHAVLNTLLPLWVLICAFPPALLLHSAYLEPSFTSSNFNHISFLSTSLSHITAQPKSLESTEDEFYPSASIYIWR